MSRPLFCCDVIQLSRAFKLVVTQNCWVACFLVATWNLGHDQVFSLLSAILVATSKVCRDNPFFISSRNLISKSQQFPSLFLFLVATSLFCFVMEYMLRPRFDVATWLYCFLMHFMSRPQKYVTTSFLLSAIDPWSQLPFSCCDLKLLSFYCLVATRNLGRNLIISFLFEIYVATLKICHNFNYAPPVATSLLGHNIFNCTAPSYCHDINSRSRP